MAAAQGDREAREVLQLLSDKPTSRDINRWYQTGNNYYYGNNGVKIDYTEAFKWYRKAALMGHADAQNYLGTCCALGYGVTKDNVEAVKWYRKAAEQGNKYAQSNLGARYYNGEVLAKDYVEAAKWYRKSAENGNQNAQYKLGWAISMVKV